MQNADAKRIALLRDLLMDYPEAEPTGGSIPVPPEGMSPEQGDAWTEEQLLMSAPPLPLEGRYDGDMGRPNASMVPSGQGAWQDVHSMRERLARQLRGQ